MDTHTYKYSRAIYKDAEMMMSACNSKAVINTFHRVYMPYIDAELKANNVGGTDLFNQHPLVLVFADILLNCAGCQSHSESVQLAYSAVMDRAHTECPEWGN